MLVLKTEWHISDTYFSHETTNGVLRFVTNIKLAKKFKREEDAQKVVGDIKQTANQHRDSFFTIEA